MYRQLFKENALGQAIAKTKRVQHINFTIEPAQAFDEGIARQATEIILLLKGLHQGIPLLLDPGKVAERRIAQVEVHFTQAARPVKQILIQLVMNSAQIG
ncbi:hypothetical protein UUU_39580 [Klebsiella pneumoniae subsp. pneumoniae DSM 30104 = JCM 1662 = NBRC 14940]|nr:hypothetical protein UUU_39580 [Klebsiella pneumoniae subsp. pneumoniae DSM 30104 = JCM 1662 = NBRC 14940]